PTPGNLKVSLDGGATWVQAPEQGIAPDWFALEGPLWVLSDGTVMLSVIKAGTQLDQYTSTLYCWKPGDTAWHQIAPTVPERIAYLLVLGQPETIWMVTWTGGNVYHVQRLSWP